MPRKKKPQRNNKSSLEEKGSNLFEEKETTPSSKTNPTHTIEPEGKKVKVLRRSKSNVQPQSNHQQKKNQGTLGDVPEEEEESKSMSTSTFNVQSRFHSQQINGQVEDPKEFNQENGLSKKNGLLNLAWLNPQSPK